MRKAARGNQPSELQKLAHRLTGANANLGASPMSEICKELNEQGRARDVGGATELISQLEKALACVELFFSVDAAAQEVEV